ncbi:prolyl oligopeptidase family serine peptidase [Saccharibacter sp. 17.LH.SD]|uniref:prolyl oligopeptidase family serine peptidase n=1 Tax=Saccharibacter sp. 17.LH.SD TaxID=2689393 RepID=UPI001F023D7B|nr:prolyl oligopeptidase family serine peptidase [Saccharibacter sp. 17.LH.SD]
MSLESWVSPQLIIQKNRTFSELRADQGWVLWLERRPEDGGRHVVVGRSHDGTIHDLTPQESDVGTNVNVYGGGAWTYRFSEHGIEVIFSDRRRGGLWLSLQGHTSQLWCAETGSDGKNGYFADLAFSSSGKEVFCVREVHVGDQESAQIVSVSSDGDISVLDERADFYASPRPSPDGCYLAWIAWDNPHMPWTETRLCVMSLEERNTPIYVLEGEKEACSVMEPLWDGERLYALSDRSCAGHERVWAPIAFVRSENRWRDLNLPHAGLEVGLPAWVFGQRSYVALPHGELLVRGIKEGFSQIRRYSPKAGWRNVEWGGTPENVPFPLNKDEADFAWIDAPADHPPSLMIGRPGAKGHRFREAWHLPEGVERADIAVPRVIQCETSDDIGPVRALFYAPAHGKHCVKPDAKPPLVVIVHGGPTGQARTDLSFKVQWWASRGFAVLDVNYRGSTGFGRSYREALNGLWGVRDVQDCCLAVREVVKQGLVDPARCVIRGSSAGGLTVLSALAQSDLFVAGTSLYGVTDLRGLVADTHRFEARYLDGLIAPWPEGEATYLERSPVSWPEKIKAPVLFLHGDADKVVPLAQAEALVGKLEEASLHVYPKEGHGFRQPDVIVDAFQRELAFYQRVFACA